MTYPRNAASPPPFVVGQVVQISDGAVQTAGVSARVKTGTGAWGASAGTLTVDATSGFWEYTPTQAETNAESFSVVIYKAACIGDTRSIATSASASAGYVGTDQNKIANPTAIVNLTNTTIKSVTDQVTANVTQIGGQTASAAAPVSFPVSVANETTVASRASQTSVNLIPTNPLLTNDVRLNFLDASIATSTNSVLSAITGLNNLSAKCNLFGSAVLEAPETGSSVYEFTLVVNDDEGKLVNLDSNPTVTATNASGTDRSANLSSVTNPSTGRYRFTYTVSSSHSRESLRIEASGTTSTEARYAIWAGSVVDYDVTSILTQIQSSVGLIPTNPLLTTDIRLNNLNAPINAIPTNPLLTTDSRLGYLDASISSRATQTSVDALPNTTRNLVMNSMPGAGWDNGSFGDRWLISNDNQRTVAVTGAHHVAADLHESQPNSIHPTSFESTVYDTISADLLGTVHTGYITPGTVGKTLNDTNTSLSTLLTRVPIALAQLVTDLTVMLVGSGTALVKWTANALSLGPTGEQQTIVATVTVPAVLQNTAFALDELLVYRGTYWSFQVQNLGDLTPYNQIWFCLRKRQNDDETQSDLLIALNGGLLIANKQTATNPLLASLTANSGTVTIQVDESVTQFIDTGNNYNYDLKGRNAAGHTIMLHESDKFVVKRDVTRRIS